MVYTDILSVCYYLPMLWISYQLFLTVSRMFNRRIRCSLLKYSRIGMRFISINADEIWIVLRIKSHIPKYNCVIILSQHLFHLQWRKISHVVYPIKARRRIVFKCPNNLKTMVQWMMNLLARSLRFPNLQLHQVPTLFFYHFKVFYFFENQD